MRFMLINREKERMLNALFPDFTNRLQVACFRYWRACYDSVIVTSGDNVDLGDFFDDEDYLISIYKDEITPVFEEGDPFVTEIPEDMPDGDGAFCEYGPLGDDGYETDRFYGSRWGRDMVISNEHSAARRWACFNEKYGECNAYAYFDRLIPHNAIYSFLKAECKRRGLDLFKEEGE